MKAISVSTALAETTHMLSPFPGMDPYLESQGWWQDFHTSSAVYCRSALTADLPDGYVALIGADERAWTREWPNDFRQRRINEA
jgi:hypothetical protein